MACQKQDRDDIKVKAKPCLSLHFFYTNKTVAKKKKKDVGMGLCIFGYISFFNFNDF